LEELKTVPSKVGDGQSFINTIEEIIRVPAG